MKRYLYMMSLLLICMTACRSKTEDHSQVRTSVQTAIELFKQRDARKFADVFTNEARYINFSTRDLISGADDIAQWCIATTSGQEKISVEHVEMKDADHAFVTGLIEVSEPPLKLSIRVELVKRDGTWLIDQARTVNIEKAPSHYEQLKDLEWLVGAWVNKNDAVVLKSGTHWDENKNFLKQDYMVNILDQKELLCEQIIGWDPATKTIRSWLFDTDGGFGSGVWSKQEDCWYVRVSYTLPDGLTAVSTNIYTKIDDNTFTFTSVGRDIDGQVLPNIGPYTVHRKEARSS